jgi:8-oxo-dGTP pyrophosphatase MutT (NUDIX family)
VDFLLNGTVRLKPADAAVAIITMGEDLYLMQLRDQKPGIFYPGHWGLFGGAIDAGEDPVTALKRELAEELGLRIAACDYFTNFTFDYGPFGNVSRRFYEVALPPTALDTLVLNEGSAMRSFRASEILNLPRVVPYDSFALWLHASGALRPS